ncbi:MAG: 4Fe-4S binding protein [Desulfobacterales bacterium]|nr:4Fe-4S binding protein [Desulfobacterales bacterium]MCF8078767.1 4Fe-4S binding protein [Desulfobacterales bacterium]
MPVAGLTLFLLRKKRETLHFCFGGAIKNVGMGCASRKGKLAQHSSVSPKVDEEKCVACGDCAERCSQGAIEVGDDSARIHPERCIGCGECILICPG